MRVENKAIFTNVVRQLCFMKLSSLVPTHLPVWIYEEEVLFLKDIVIITGSPSEVDLNG